MADEPTTPRVYSVNFATERPVPRWYGRLKLRVDEESIDRSRVELGQMPFLASHDPTKPIGKVDSITIDAKGKIASASVRMDTSRLAQEHERRIDADIQTGISPGVNVMKMVKLDGDGDDGGMMSFEATSWEVMELSSTAVPANPEARIMLESDLVGPDRMVISDQLAYQAWKERSGSNGNGNDSSDDNQNGRIPGRTPMSDDLTAVLDKFNATVEKLSTKVDELGAASAPAPAPTPAEIPAEITERLDKAAEDIQKVSDRNAILEMGAKYNLMDEAVKHDGTLESFRDKALTISFQPNPVSRQPTSPDQRFSLGKLVQHLADPMNADIQRFAALEIQAIREHDLQGKIPNGSLTGGAIVPMEKLAIATTAIDGSIQTDVDLGRAYQWLVDQAMIAKYCTIIPGLIGNLEFPVATGGVTVGYTAEGILQADSTPTLGKVSLSPNTLSARTTLTRQSVMQTGGWLDGFIREMIGIQFGEQIDTGILVGTGSNNQPTGVLNQVGIKEVAAYGSSLAWSTFTLLEKEIRAGKHMDRGGRIFTLDPSAFQVAQIKSKDAGSGQFIIESDQRAMYDGQMMAMHMIDGYPAIPTTLMPADTILFGEFMDVHVGLWDGLIVRVDDVTDATNFKISAAQFWDVDVPRPTGFAKVAKA